MATIFANYSFDQSNLNLNRLYANSFDAGLLDDAFITYNGTTYRDIYIVDWYLGGYYGSAFAGDYISVDQLLNVTGGTVTGYLEVGWNGVEYVDLWGIEDISVSALALYQTAVTTSTADEYALINKALEGNDEFYLSNGNDIAFGQGGNDRMFGFSGNDLLSGGAGNDIIIGGFGNDTLDGGAGNDELNGGSGNDFLFGRDGNDLFYGEGGNDTLYGEAGDDVFYGGIGNDLIDGDVGNDTAGYSGNQASYTLTLSPTSTSITDRRADGNGTDQLIDIEFLDFDTEAFPFDFNLNQFGGPTGLSESQFESFIELYIAYFNRAPDAVGLNFWGTAYANGTTLQEMATLFIDQDETRATYPTSLSNADFATAVYNNVLGRIPDQAGFDFWVGILESGARGRDQFILSVLEGVQDGSPDQAYLSNKIDIGAYFAVHKGMSDVDNASAAMALFDGTQAGIDNAVTAIDGFYADALDPSNGEFLMQVVGVLDDPFAVA
jgi:hypothetical protein